MKLKFAEVIRVTLFVLIGACLIYVVHSSLSRLTVTEKEGYHLKALFRDLRQLQVGDEVRLAGVRVGSIVDTYLDKDLAVALIKIEKRYQIPEDSIATILMSGLLGSNYVAIAPGSSTKELTNEMYIETRSSADLSSVIHRFGKIGKRLDRILEGVEEGLLGESTEGDEADEEVQKSKKTPSLLADLGNFFRENRPKFNNIIDSIEKVSHNLAQGEGTLGKLIQEDKAYDELLSMMQEIKEAANKVDVLIENVQEITNRLKNGEGVLAKLLSDQQTSKDFDNIVKNLREFSEKLNNDKSTLGRLVTDDTLYRKAEDALSKVEKAGDSINHTGPVTAVGVAASALF